MANDLTFSVAPVYDTTSPKFGTANLASGVGNTPAGATGSGKVFTWECQIRIAAPPSSLQVFLGAGSDNAAGWLGMDASGHIQGNILANNTTITSSATYADGAWHHIEMDGTTTGIMLFVDGILVASSDVVEDVPAAMVWTIGALQPAAYFQWSGFVDEVAFWGVTRHTAAFTPPAAAYTGSEVGLTALYHLDSASSDSVAIAASPAASVPMITLGVASPAARFSPGNWRGDTGRGGTVYRQSWNNGAWFSYTWTASASPTAAILLNSPSTGCALSYFLNGVLTDNVAANAASIALSGIVLGASNTVRVYLRNSPQSARWNGGANTVQVRGLQVDAASSAGVAPAAQPWGLIVGDSITEGIEASGGSDNTLVDYSHLVARAMDRLGYDVGVSACGYSGWLCTGDSGADVPGYYSISGSTGGAGGAYSDVASRWNKVDAGVSLLDANGQMSAYGATGTPPTFILLNYMTNEALSGRNVSDAQASVTQAITALRGAAPSALIAVLVPFGIYNTARYPAAYLAALKAGIAGYRAANFSDGNIALLDLGSSLSATITAGPYTNGDGVHPLAAGHALVAPMVASSLTSLLAPKSQARSYVFS